MEVRRVERPTVCIFVCIFFALCAQTCFKHTLRVEYNMHMEKVHNICRLYSGISLWSKFAFVSLDYKDSFLGYWPYGFLTVAKGMLKSFAIFLPIVCLSQRSEGVLWSGGKFFVIYVYGKYLQLPCGFFPNLFLKKFLSSKSF